MKSQRNRSLQTIHRLRQQEIFLGREQQETSFQHNLMLDEELRTFIFNVFGQGGVGKTSLIRRFCLLAENVGAVVAWSDETQKDLLAALESIAKQFEKQGHDLRRFSKAYKTYLQRCQELATDPDAPSGIADFFSSLAKVGIRFGRHTPAGAVLELMDEDAVAKGTNDLVNSFVTHVKRKLSNEDARLVQKPIEELTPLFLEDLWEVSQNHTVALFFDTYEYTGDYLEGWLLDCLDGRYGEIPANFVLSIAGRDELDRNRWEAYDGILAHVPLEPFTEEDARKYLTHKGIVDERIIEVILRLSKCLPLLVATLAAERPSNPGEIGNPNGTAVDRFLKWVTEPRRRQTAIDAALPRQVNRDIIAVLVGEQDANALFSWLKRMPFVREYSSGWVYHDVVRTQIIRNKYIETPQGWSDLHGRLADYYKNLQNSLELEEEQGRADATWQSFALEECYHLLCQSPQKHLTQALNGFLAGFGYQGTFAQRWAETMRQAGEDSVDATVLRWGELLCEGVRDSEENHYEEAASMFSELLNNTDIEERWYQKALRIRANLYFNANQYPLALADYNKIIESTPDDIWPLLLRSFTYLRMDSKNECFADWQRIEELESGFLNNLVDTIQEVQQDGKSRSFYKLK